jgi:hypothetical protein
MQWPTFVAVPFEASVNGATQAVGCAPPVAWESPKA